MFHEIAPTFLMKRLEIENLHIFCHDMIHFTYNTDFLFLQGKALIRPIAFRPTPGPNSGASTPTNGPLILGGTPGFRPGSSNGTSEVASLVHSHHHAVTPQQGGSMGGPFNPVGQNNEGFAPGHPLIKEGRRHYGSK